MRQVHEFKIACRVDYLYPGLTHLMEDRELGVCYGVVDVDCSREEAQALGCETQTIILSLADGREAEVRVIEKVSIDCDISAPSCGLEPGQANLIRFIGWPCPTDPVAKDTSGEESPTPAPGRK